jgi:hypothetical protein
MNVSRLLAIAAVVCFVLALVGFHAGEAEIVGFLLIAASLAV